MITVGTLHRLAVVLGIAVLCLSACSRKPSDTSAPMNTAGAVDSIFYGGDILTMEGDAPQYAEALAVKDGKIVLVGSKADAEAQGLGHHRDRSAGSTG